MEIQKFDSKIELENDGKLSLFFLGTGNAFSHKNFQTNLLVIKGSDHVLIDCGTLCSFILESQYNTKPSEIKNFLLTHPHADHIGGIEEFGLMSKYVKREKINMIITNKFKKLLWNESLKGGFHYNEDGELSFDDYFNQLKPEVFCRKPYKIYNINVGSINLKLYRTWHITSRINSFRNSQISYGVIIDNKVLFTSDSQFKEDQLKWILNNFNIETIFHDCDVLGHSERVHASYRQLNLLDKSIKSKIYLCHYDEASKMVNPVKDGFAGFAQAGQYYIL